MDFSARWGRLSRLTVAAVAIAVITYYYVAEGRKHADAISQVAISPNALFLCLALLLSLFSYLAEAVIWKLILRGRAGGAAMTYREIAAVLFTSGVFRYLPGRAWTVAAQALWLAKFGISKSATLFLNLVLMVQLCFVSLYFSLIYLGVSDPGVRPVTLVSLLAALLAANALYVTFGSHAMQKAMARVLPGMGSRPISVPALSMCATQGVYVLSWSLTGCSVYCLAKGLGLPISPADTIPILAAGPVAGLAGHLSLIVPAGLGIREGVMLLMLKPALAVQTAFLLPITSRALSLVAEGLLGLLGLCLGIRYRVFSGRPEEHDLSEVDSSHS